MYNGTSRWGQAFDHWCLAVFSFWYTWLYGGVTCFVSLLSFPLSLPFDLTLSYWVYVCCFVLFYFGCYVMLCYVMLCYFRKKKKMLITKKKNVNNKSYCIYHQKDITYRDMEACAVQWVLFSPLCVLWQMGRPHCACPRWESCRLSCRICTSRASF